MADRAPLSALFDLPTSLDAIAIPLGPLLEKVAIEAWDTLFVPVAVDPNPDPPTDGLTEEEALSGMQGDDSIPPVDEPLGPQVTPPTNPPPPVPSPERLSQLALQLLSNIEVPLAGVDLFKLVVNPQGFQGKVHFTDNGVSIEIALALALRFDRTLVKPARELLVDGQLSYEEDTAAPPVTVEIATARVKLDEARRLSLDADAGLNVTRPLMLGGSGVVVRKGKMVISVSGNGPHPDGAAPGWKGVLFDDVEIFVPGLGLVKAPRIAIGTDGLCLVVEVPASQMDDALKRIGGGLPLPGGSASTALLQVLGGGGRSAEARLDLSLGSAGVRIKLPWAEVAIPGGTLLSLITGGAGRSLTQLAVVATFDGTKGPISAETNFAWIRGEGGADQRELSEDDARTADPPLLALAAKPPARSSLVLADVDLSVSSLPKFLRALTTPLTALTAGAGCGQTSLVLAPALTGWTVDLHADLSKAFNFPFLRRKGEAPDDDQLLRVTSSGVPSIDIAGHKVSLDFQVMAKIGTLELGTQLTVSFDWEVLAFRINHDAGEIVLSSPDKKTIENTYLGLNWRFQGAPSDAATGAGPYRYLILVTKNYNYQLQQAPGAVLTLEYDKASADPIQFAVSDFAVSAKGINLTAAVTDVPVRLNGVDQKFRFTEGRLEIKENRISDFTIAGSGDLPPDLVGKATADIALQFGQQGGGLTLLMGAARLRGTDKLKCQGTRFQFAIDAIGLKFVNDGKFHLYFTLTGRAQFVLSQGDDLEPLALLGKIQIDLVECPLAGDVRVLAKHIKFLVELPKPRSFNFLGCFEMELRGIGFQPQAEVFDGDAAMLITGKLKFAQGAGDTPDPKVDFHQLLIGLPPKGSFIPRIHFENLPVHLNLGEAFRVNGSVNFVDRQLEKGFMGDGVLQIQGLPQFAASFAFLRVRRDADSPWVRAWFFFIEVRQISFMIPVVQVYLREVGLGFGYRFTLVSLKAADRANDLKQLIAELTKLSRTQGDLSKRDRWEVDLEGPGEDPRFTVALRAMISQTSAAPSPLRWDPGSEKDLSCVYLMEATLALRSDLTFLMVVRGWLNANYYDYVTDADGSRSAPLVSGFVLLSPRRKRFLAHLASNPEGKVGKHPELPPFVKNALTKSQFSATLLIEPGLMHFELGWPNMLRWADKLGPLDAEFRGGFIFRISNDELVIGNSFLARARLEVSAEANLGIVGARVSAKANVAFGARYIGLFDFRQPAAGSAIYGGIGLEAHIQFSIEFWIRIKIGFIKIQKTFRFSLGLDFTAGLEVGFANTSFGVRGQGTVAVSFMGRRLQLSAHFGLNEGAVSAALARTKHVLDLGLEATEVEPLPGLPPSGAGAATRALPAPMRAMAAPRTAMRRILTAAAPPAEDFKQPAYVIFSTPSGHKEKDKGGKDQDVTYFALLPQGERPDGTTEVGFLPPPPLDASALDFELNLPAAGPNPLLIERFDPATQTWKEVPANGTAVSWSANWAASAVDSPTRLTVDDTSDEISPAPPDTTPMKLLEYLGHAFIQEGDPAVPTRDPSALPDLTSLKDERVHSPTDNAFEAAVRGAYQQFQGAPYFRRDLRSPFEARLQAAFDDQTSIYAKNGRLPDKDDPTRRAAVAEAQAEQQAHELRGVIVHDMVADLQAYAAATTRPAADSVKSSVLFQLGLALRARGARPSWLDAVAGASPTLRQRTTGNGSLGDPTTARPFNTGRTNFRINPPEFRRVQVLTDAATIGLAWELAWTDDFEPGLTPAQKDPEHHLLQYQVRRRELGGNEPEAVFTVKGADVLHREESGGSEALVRLHARFQVVDHFNRDTLADLVSLPSEGRRYLYTVTPIDFAGNPGRPLTVAATRRPSEPPLVPVDAECVVSYDVTTTLFDPAQAGSPAAPRLLTPQPLRLTWSDPKITDTSAQVPVAAYFLVVRRESTLPIGSYGLDGATERGGPNGMPATNSRRLPTDIAIRLPTPTGNSKQRQVSVTLADLRAQGVFPAADGAPWEPRAYRLFLQTESFNGVPSALAPVSLRLRFFPTGTAAPDTGPREERRPAELEWLPKPMRFPLLPPEDQAAETGDVHVPMPQPDAIDGSFRFTAQVNNARYQRHPAGTRVVRFRFNQAPSKERGWALELAAAFELLELDIDSHTTDAFAQKSELADALRLLQEVQMIPGADQLLVPGDTHTPGQWEAFYPSDVQRRFAADESSPVGAETRRKAWLSPRDAYLDWPVWPGLTDGGFARTSALHPVLGRIVELLARPADATLNGGKPLSVDLQTSPPAQPQDLGTFLQATSPASDPYGWGVLQRFGLSSTFSLRDPQTGEVLAAAKLLTAIEDVFTYLDGVEGGKTRWELAGLASAKDYLFVELLYQPGRRIRLRPDELADAPQLLGLVQISLRPRPVPRLRYYTLQVANVAKKKLDVEIVLAAGRTAWLLIQTEREPREEKLTADSAANTFKRSTVAALDGTVSLLLRTEDALADTDVRVASEGKSIPATLSPLDFRDFRTTYFKAPLDFLAASIERTGDGAAAAWDRLRHYLESLSSTDPAVSDTEKIHVPASGPELASTLPDLLNWTQRFFDASGGFDQTDLAKRPAALPGPQLATAYPRTGSPAFASPDETGRLTYDHLIEDPWGHTYRYYIRPSGRYDRLWRSLQQSPSLFPTGRFAVTDETPEPSAGALDVVLDRVRPVEPPLVLGSSRLDGVPVPGAPAAPGATWEVTVAEHPEQTLIERNQTLVRQLGFRGVAFTLLRRFATPDWPALLATAGNGGPINLKVPSDTGAAAPATLPSKPENVDVGALTERDRRTLDLPLRLGGFQQGALVVQWEALPFFYEHRLLLIAQTTRLTSRFNEVSQRDFEYLSPTPEGTIEGAVRDWKPEPPFGPASGPPTVPVHAEGIEVPLRRLWESLPAEVQQRWPFEAPDGATLKPGWLADLEVVYQIVALASGNIEVQGEVAFDQTPANPHFARRQIGKQFLVDVTKLTGTVDAGKYFRLGLMVQPVADEASAKTYGAADKQLIATPTRHKVAFDPGRLRFAGVLTAADQTNLKAVLQSDDHSLVDRLFASWYTQEPVSTRPPTIPAALTDTIDFPDPASCWLIWEGPMSAAEKTALLALPGDPEWKTALAALADKASSATVGQVTVVAAPRGADQVPDVVKDQVSFGLNAAGANYTSFTWTGPLYDDRLAVLEGWAQIATFRAAVAAVRAAAEATLIEKTLPPARPLVSELPAPLQGRLGIEDARLVWHGPAPGDAERATLLGLSGDVDFLDARDRLLAAIDVAHQVPLPPETVPPGQIPRRPRPADLPAVLQGRLVIGASTLGWNPPAPSDAERATLLALGGDSAFDVARTALLAAIDADQSVSMVPVVRRPRPGDLPPAVAGRLTIEPTLLRWVGRLHTAAQRQALADLHGDPPFDAALASLLADLDGQAIVVPFASPLRPAQAQLPPILGAKLLIGRVLLRHHGIIARDEATALAGALSLDLDKHAVRRLYRLSQKNALRGRALKLRARRGSAAPTPFVDLTAPDPE